MTKGGQALADAINALLHKRVTGAVLIEELWRSRASVMALCLVPAILAVGIGLLMPRWYRTGASMAVDAGNAPNLSSLAGLADQIGLTGMSRTSPQFYSDLLDSRYVRERIIRARYPVGRGAALMSLDRAWGGGDSVTPRMRETALQKLGHHFSASSNTRTGVVSFTIEGTTPTVAQLMADTALAALNDLVISLRRTRATAERTFLQQRWDDLRDSLTRREDELRDFYRRNRIIGAPDLQFEEMRLKREVDRVAAVYASMGQQLEQARIQEVRDTPALGVIDAPYLPVRKSSPSLRWWAISAAAIGLGAALLVSLLRLARLASRGLEPERLAAD